MSILDHVLDFFGIDDAPGKTRHHHASSHAVWIHYTNHKGVLAWRLIRPLALAFGSTEFHPDKQWFLHALDVKRSVERHFAMVSIHSWHHSTNPDSPPVVVLLPTGVTVEVKS